MRTYTHGVIGYLLYAKRPRHEQRLAVLGGILPDVFLALGFVAHSLENLTHSAMAAEFHTLLHHSTLHTVTVSMHSFVIVGPWLALSAVLYKIALVNRETVESLLGVITYRAPIRVQQCLVFLRTYIGGKHRLEHVHGKPKLRAHAVLFLLCAQRIIMYEEYPGSLRSFQTRPLRHVETPGPLHFARAHTKTTTTLHKIDDVDVPGVIIESRQPFVVRR